jgi:hypothetical protein
VTFFLKLGVLVGRNFDVTVERAACDEFSAKRNFGTNSPFTGGMR